MQLKFKNNFIGYFRFYYAVTGYKLLFYIFLSICVGILDGIGLAMFIPLLQAVSNSSANSSSLGKLHFLTDAIQGLGFSLTINTVLFVMVTMFFLKGLIKLFQLNYGVKLQHAFMRKVRNHLLDDLENLSYKGFLKLDAGRIQNTLIGEVQRLFQTMYFYFNALQSMVILLIYIALAFLSNFQFAFLVAVGASLLSLIYRRLNKNTKMSSVEFSLKGHDFNSYLIQAVNNYKYLKSTGYFSNFKEKLKGVINDTEMLNRRMGFLSAITISSREPLIIGIVCMIIYLQVNFIGSHAPGESVMSTILLSLLLFYRALMSLMMVQNYWQFFIQNVGAMSSVSVLMNEMHGLQEQTVKTQVAPPLKQSVSLHDLSFSFGDTKVINAINLEIPKNKTVAFLGESGSGKTTLVNLIAGLIQPDKGEVCIDSMPVKNYNVNAYRRKIGYISQEPVIFNDNIYNNITFWAERTEENVKRFWDIVELSLLSQFVATQPKKEHTVLGDNGILISGGQKQRIAIARELYKNIEILILDEATSALDSETERLIMENVEKLYGSYTMIIVAHRLSTIKNADTVYMLEKGKIAASGTFYEMLELSEKFKYLVSLQSL